MWIEYNPNPSAKRVGDCVIRAIAKAVGKTWEEAYIELCLLGYIKGDLPSSNKIWGDYLKSKGFTKDIVSDDCPDCYTIADFCEEHPQGVYVVGTGTHAVCVVSGNLFDSWDSSEEAPIYFYKKEN